MQIIQAIILGAVQGLTEFIPISSSGHLIAIPRLFGWSDLGLSFDVGTHLGTLLALVIYFRADWANMLREFWVHLRCRKPYEKNGVDEAGGRLIVPILVACIPAAVVGYLWEGTIETALRHWYSVAGALVLAGLIMLVAELMGKRERQIGQMNYVDYISIGCAQAMALFPGVSRSGITISAGLFRNLDRAAAARFSFLMSTPIIFGAGMLKVKDVLEAGEASAPVVCYVAGFASAAVVGYLAIRFLMSFLKKHSLIPFVVYRVCFAAFMAWFFLR